MFIAVSTPHARAPARRVYLVLCPHGMSRVSVSPCLVLHLIVFRVSSPLSLSPRLDEHQTQARSVAIG
jgi:hypothetical protein